MKNKVININITTSTIIKTIILLSCLWFLIYIRGIVGVFIVSLLFTASLKPAIAWLEKKKLPRSLAITAVYILIFAIMSFALFLIIPPIIQQTKQLAELFPSYWEKIMSALSYFKNYSSNGWMDKLNKIGSSFEKNIADFTGNIFGAISSIFGGVASFIFILVITFYMTLEKNAAERILNFAMPKKYQARIISIIEKLEEKIGLWVRGQITLMIIIGIAAFLGLAVLRINYALTLGLIAGLTEIIPYLGPFIGAIPAIFIAFTQSPYKAIGVIILYFIIQVLENDIIAPKVMERAVGLNPIISIFALLIGFKIAGILGILLAIPVTTSIIVLIKEFYPDIRGRKSNDSSS